MLAEPKMLGEPKMRAGPLRLLEATARCASW